MLENYNFLIVVGVIMLFLIIVVRIVRKSNMETFLSDGLCIDETRVSVIMIAFVIFIFIAIWTVFTMGDIPNNVLYLLIGLGGGITGMNIAPNSQIANANITKKVREVVEEVNNTRSEK